MYRNVPVSSQGFPGFQPANEVKASRSNVGMYADAELDVTKAFLLAGAVRFENYSDFGGNTTGKLSTRVELSENLFCRVRSVRGFGLLRWPRSTEIPSSLMW